MTTEEERVEVCRERDALREELDDARKALSDYSINIINVPLGGGVRELARRADDFMQEVENLRKERRDPDNMPRSNATGMALGNFIAKMQAKIEKYEVDLKDAAGELLVSLPEPGTDMGKMLAANVLLRRENENLRHERDEARANLAEASKLWDGPETGDWLEGVRKEGAHQVARWGVGQDAGKSPFDWFWLIGYLAQKAAASAVAGDVEKAKHHTVSTGAALLNWHAQLSGVASQFRPGIEEPKGETP